jgi:hypothetical protein
MASCTASSLGGPFRAGDGGAASDGGLPVIGSDRLPRHADRASLETMSHDRGSLTSTRTAAVVNHTLARLRYWRDMGLLFIRDDGTWYEAAVPQGFTTSAPSAQPQPSRSP